MMRPMVPSFHFRWAVAANGDRTLEQLFWQGMRNEWRAVPEIGAPEPAPAPEPVAWMIETLSDEGERLNLQFVAAQSIAACFDKPYHRVTPLCRAGGE